MVAGRIDAADALADAALEWAAASDDEWTIAEVAKAKAYAASTLAELRERVDRAASLLAEVGNVYEVANLFSSAAYQALCLAGENDAKQLVDRALPITRELDSPYLSMILHGNLGLAALLTGDPDAARQAFRDQLELCRELVVPPVSSEGLLGLAAVATVHDDLDRAARLAGAADAHRYGQPTGPVEARLHATFFERARARHGASTWDRAMSEGAALSFNDAIATALEEPAREDGRLCRTAGTRGAPGLLTARSTRGGVRTTVREGVESALRARRGTVAQRGPPFDLGANAASRSAGQADCNLGGGRLRDFAASTRQLQRGRRMPTRIAVRCWPSSAHSRSPRAPHRRTPIAVHCGDIVTQSVRLADDLADCPADGLVIGADNVAVDLNGHTLSAAARQLSHRNPRRRTPSGKSLQRDGHRVLERHLLARRLREPRRRGQAVPQQRLRDPARRVPRP